MRISDGDPYNGIQIIAIAEKHWISLRSKEKVADVFNGIKFEDGMKVEEKQEVLVA